MKKSNIALTGILILGGLYVSKKLLADASTLTSLPGDILSDITSLPEKAVSLATAAQEDVNTARAGVLEMGQKKFEETGIIVKNITKQIPIAIPTKLPVIKPPKVHKIKLPKPPKIKLPRLF